MRIVYDTEDAERIRGIIAAAASYNATAADSLSKGESAGSYTPLTAEQYVVTVLDAHADSWARQFPAPQTPEEVRVERDTLREDKARLEAENANLQRQLAGKAAAGGAAEPVKP